MNSKKTFLVYSCTSSGVDLLPVFVSDYLLEICSFLDGVITPRTIPTAITRNDIIRVNNRYYKVYRVLIDEE